MCGRSFSGTSEALLKAGAVTGDILRDSRWLFEAACLSCLGVV